MTVTEDRDRSAAVEVASSVGQADPTSRQNRRRGVRRIGGLAFIAVVVLLVTVFLVEDPIAHVWYQVRQQHLASTFKTARPVHDGDPVAVLQVPAQGINVTIVQGAGPGVLRSGPAHRPGSPLPGQLGNSVIFGHESGWGAPFHDLALLKDGDNIFVQARTANGPGLTYFFRVSATKVVAASDRRPYANSNDHRLTLVTAAAGGGRLVVTAVSGSEGRLDQPGPRTTASTGTVAPSATWPLVGLAMSIAAIGLLAVLLRRRPRGTAGLLAATPLAMVLLLCVVLLGDALLRSPLS